MGLCRWRPEGPCYGDVTCPSDWPRVAVHSVAKLERRLRNRPSRRGARLQQGVCYGDARYRGAGDINTSAIERASRTAGATAAVAPAAATRATAVAATATATGIAVAAATATAALGHAVYAGPHWVWLAAPVARVAMAGVAVAHVGAQVGVGTRRLRIVMAMASAATVLARASAACWCWLSTAPRPGRLAATGTTTDRALGAACIAAAGASTPPALPW